MLEILSTLEYSTYILGINYYETLFHNFLLFDRAETINVRSKR